MPARALALVFLVAAVGCRPSLGDGVFSCDDGVCPPGQRCDPDHVCRRPMMMERDAGRSDDVGPLDGGPPLGSPPFAPCTFDAECEPGFRCFRGPESEWTTVGYCALPCTTLDDTGMCPPRPMSETHSVCLESMTGNVCQMPCGGLDGACPPGYACVAWHREPSGSGFIDFGDCIPPGEPIPAVDPVPCTSDDMCFDGTCATLGGTRVCARPCGGVYRCATGFACVSSPDRGFVCDRP